MKVNAFFQAVLPAIFFSAGLVLASELLITRLYVRFGSLAALGPSRGDVQ